MTNQVPEQSPVRIEHCVDEAWDPKAGELEYYYNYLVYSFEHPLGEVRARSYLDTPHTVSIFMPTVDDIERDFAGILRYFRTRYTTLKRLGGEGYVEIPDPGPR